MGNLFSAPEVQTTATEDLEKDRVKTKKARQSLLATEGGVSGQELQAGEVKQRPTLLGN